MKEIISTSNAPATIGPYSQANMSGGFVFTSGQLPIDPATGKFPSDDIADQTRQSLENIKAILEQSGLTMDDILKTTVFLKDIKDFGRMNEVYSTFFSEGKYPSRSAFQVAALPMDAKVEIEAVAARQ